jgi:ribosome-associated translation inhibitor RaiA
MKLKIRTSGLVMTESLRRFIEQRVYFAMSRFSPRIASISAVVEDINGPRGGVDQRCRIVVKLDGARELTVEATDADLHGAITFATDRAGRVVQRELERRRTATRQPQRRHETPSRHEEGMVSSD